MKIIINEQIIDTDNIFSISTVKEGAYLNFEIKFFNNKSLDIEIPNWITPDELSYVRSLPKDEQYLHTLKINTERVEKFKKTWTELVNIWSNNQTTLPRFNF